MTVYWIPKTTVGCRVRGSSVQQGSSSHFATSPNLPACEPAGVARNFTILLLAIRLGRRKSAGPSRSAVAKAYADPKDALADIEPADAAYGTVPPELFARAKKLRWICASRAGLGAAYFHDALVNSNIAVTGMHGSYFEHLSTHAVAFLLALATDS